MKKRCVLSPVSASIPRKVKRFANGRHFQLTVRQTKGVAALALSQTMDLSWPKGIRFRILFPVNAQPKTEPMESRNNASRLTSSRGEIHIPAKSIVPRRFSGGAQKDLPAGQCWQTGPKLAGAIHGSFRQSDYFTQMPDVESMVQLG